MTEAEARKAMSEQYAIDGHPQARRILWASFRDLSYSERIAIRAMMALTGDAPATDAQTAPGIREAAERLAARMGGRMVWDHEETPQ